MDIIKRLDEAASKQNVRKKLQKLDSTLDEFIDDLEDKALKIEDNPVFQKKVLQLLADTNKEYGEFMMAMKRVASALDSKAQNVAREKGSMQFKPQRDVYGGDEEEPEQPQQPQDQEGQQAENIIHESSSMMKNIRALSSAMEKVQKFVNDRVSYLSGKDLAKGASLTTELNNLKTKYLATLAKLNEIME